MSQDYKGKRNLISEETILHNLTTAAIYHEKNSSIGDEPFCDEFWAPKQATNVSHLSYHFLLGIADALLASLGMIFNGLALFVFSRYYIKSSLLNSIWFCL